MISRLADEGDCVQYRRQLIQPRVAEMIADTLRRRILDGELNDGDLLPNVDDLLVEFPGEQALHPGVHADRRDRGPDIGSSRQDRRGYPHHQGRDGGYMLGMFLQAR